MNCDQDDGRPATKYVHFLGEWRPKCRYHVAAFYDLPQRTVERHEARGEPVYHSAEWLQAKMGDEDA